MRPSILSFLPLFPLESTYPNKVGCTGQNRDIVRITILFQESRQFFLVARVNMLHEKTEVALVTFHILFIPRHLSDSPNIKRLYKNKI